MLQSRIFAFIALFLAPCISALLPAKLVYEFPTSAGAKVLENISVRPNGQLVLTLTSAPEVYTLDPSASNPSPNLAYTFPNATGTAGIAQVSSDVYAVVVGDYNTTTFTGTPGSFSIWKMTLSGGSATATKVTDIPSAQTLNGATALTTSPGIVLVADSVAGQIYRVNMNTGSHSVAQSSTYFQPVGSNPLGVNGIHIYGSTLYFTNSAQGIFGKVPITSTGSANGSYTVIAHDQSGELYDDFAIDSGGNSWITNHNNEVNEVTYTGQQTVQVNQTNIDQPTSAAFGNGASTCNLYIVTAGFDGTDTPAHTGQIFSVKTC